MSKTTVYCFEVADPIKGENVVAKRMATLEAIKRFNGKPHMDTAKEVDISEINDEGQYPKNFTVIYSTKSFPILNHQVGKQATKEFSRFAAAKASPFPTDEKYVFASIQVVGGWYTRSLDKDEWEWIPKKK